MERVLVTGATGFIGRNVAGLLRGHGRFSVTGSARRLSAGIEAAADLTRQEEADKLIRATMPRAIVHAAGARHGTRAELVAANITAMRNLLKAAAAIAPTPRIVIIGSAAEYGRQPGVARIAETAACRPRSDYGRTKLAATHLALRAARETGIDLTVLRLFNVVGPGMGGLPGDVARQIAGTGPVLDWSKDAVSLPMIRDFVSVDDVAEVCRRVLIGNTLPAIINVCTGYGRSFAALLAEMARLAGTELGQPEPDKSNDMAVGDPMLCNQVLGFVPSADIGAMLAAAIAWEGAGK